MRKLFGTDGIRGVAGQPPLDPATVHSFGRALGEWAGAHASAPCVLIGMDTRESGDWLARCVAAGLAEGGCSVEMAGILPTPGVAWETKQGDFVAGVMISASHNPYLDNGLKVFAHNGYKLPDSEELRLEQRMAALHAPVSELPPAPKTQPRDARDYAAFLRAAFPSNITGRRIVVDCANGAASALAPGMLRGLGADVIAIHSEPNGRNINLESGALHPEVLRSAVLKHGAEFGVAFDGDADRAMFIASSGRLVDGDHVLLICGRDLQQKGHLPGNAVVATVMSNLGLEVALRNHGIQLVRTAVGDKYVLEEMKRIGASLGGEQSGHIIFHEFSTTGDGMLTMLSLLAVWAENGYDLDALAEEFVVLPQRLVNVRFRTRKDLDGIAPVQSAIGNCNAEFGEGGRVLVRFSGTEPLARVMVEGPEISRVDHHANAIASAIELALS